MTMPHTDVRPLLVELFTEELPPKALQKLGEAFSEGLRQQLAGLNLLADDCTVEAYATPRRLAALLSAVRTQAPEQAFAEKLMPVKVGLDADGKATPALQKKLAAKGWADLDVASLARESDGKQDYLVAHGTAQGSPLADGLQQALDYALTHLPIPKVMRYQLPDGLTSVRFVRPAHGLVALHGADIVPVLALGLSSGRVTQGHRFMSTGEISLAQATDYAQALEIQGKVIPAFLQRRDIIWRDLSAAAARLQADLGDDPEVTALLDEVTALVEHPTIYAGEFDPDFLQVPQECLILTMRLNQKYFPLFDPASGKLTHRFLIVSNMQVADPSNIVEGNQRVVRPRLADARFFFDTDRKAPLESRVADLGNIVYHNKLGSQLARTERVRTLARGIAQALGGNVADADRAAQLAKADLLSNMVGEFPELQGVMGAYYALADGEKASVADAIRSQYRPRLEQPVSLENLPGAALFLAERAETLVGIWGIGLAPTGERDPYGLRRAALGLISGFEQLAAGGLLPAHEAGTLTLDALLTHAAQQLDGLIAADTLPQVQAFIYERYRNQLNAQYDRAVVDAVIAQQPPLHQVLARVQAVTAFRALPEAESLSAANKRIGNLLKKADNLHATLDNALLQEPAEQALAQAIADLTPQVQAHLSQGDFTEALSTLAQARTAVDRFFDEVMVMAEDAAVRSNRLALLQQLHQLMNGVADLSRLA